LLDAQLESGYSTIEGLLESPDIHTLLLRAPDAGTLLKLTQQIGTPELLQQLAGNLAVIDAEGGVKTLSVREKKLTGEMPTLTEGRVLLQSDWILLGLGVPLALILTALVGRAVRRRGGTTG
jgi:hypothetical protein